MESTKFYIAGSEFDNQYLFGLGRVSVQTGTVKTKVKGGPVGKLPCIEVGHIINGNGQIGTVGSDEIEIANKNRLIFQNLESLEVLQRALDFCRQKLESNKQKGSQ